MALNLQVSSLLLCFLFASALGQGQTCSGEYNGHCYLLIERELSWDEGRKTCVDDTGMDMAVITDANEQDFVVETIKNHCSAAGSSCSSWIGLYKTAADHATLRWVDDTPFVYAGDGYYQPWIKNDPNNPSHQCIRAASDYNFNWSDRSCGDKFFVLCEGIAVTSASVLTKQTFKYKLYTRSNGCLTTRTTTTRKSKFQCLDLCSIRDGCAAVAVDKTAENKHVCRLFRTCADQPFSEIQNVYVRH